MAFFDFLTAKQGADETKASAALSLPHPSSEVLFFSHGQAQWGQRNYTTLAKRSMADNPIVQRSVRMV
ncbi:MAG: hypothetical protein PVF65_07405, partial [Sphingomonadales bacterium]